MGYPKISILIPTYNRAFFLREALESMVSQVENGIECIISDNASIDNTKEVVKSFQKQYPFIKYFKNGSNVGPDQNILICLKYALGEYIWLFGDDDRMFPGAIRSVLDVMNKHKNLSLIYVNYSIYSQDFRKLIKPQAVSVFNDRLFGTANHCLETIRCHLSFMSPLVFQRKLYSLIHRPEDYIDSRLTPLYISLSVLAVTDNYSFFISHPYIGQRSSNSGGYDYFKYLVGEFCRILETVKPLGYKNATIRKTKKDIIKLFVLKKVIYLRRTDPKALKGTLSILIRHFRTFPIFWISVFPFYVVPIFFVKFMWNIHRIVMKRMLEK